ncbi:MAG TPA: hypothetical protein DEA45_03955 [Acholeplasmataceae bacterium]|nr:hypothetical protein [Acholeplasmataceae bacterium]
MKNNQRLYQVIKIGFIFISSFLLSFAFESFAFGYENILLLFVVSVVLIIMESNSYYIGSFGAIVFVLFFNFFFTEPKYSFLIDDQRYLITLVIFLVVSVLIASIMQKMHNEAVSAKENKSKTEALYEIAKSWIQVRTDKEVNQLFVGLIEENLKQRCFLYVNGQIYQTKTEDINLAAYEYQINYAINSGTHIGPFTQSRTSLDYRMIGVPGVKNHRICLLIKQQKPFTAGENEFLDALIRLYKIVIERLIFKNEEERNRMIADNERFKAQILRSISHDLRTPLTSILTGVTLLKDKQTMPDEVKLDILEEIIIEVEQMSLLIENILQMTKFQNQEAKLRFTKESVDDVLYEVYEKTKNRLKKHRLTIEKSSEVIMITIDLNLFIQVLLNLIDNAIVHTKSNAEIEINYQVNNGFFELTVSDDGGGIKGDMESIFNNTFEQIDHKDHKRSSGLGLSICRAIIAKHKGTLKAYNNQKGGASFVINIPL